MNGSACFTGHRDMAEDESSVSERLLPLLEKACTEEGIKDFYAGGARGFDTLAAKCVIALRETHADVKLHLVLPCPNENQLRDWTAEQKEEFYRVLEQADEIEYTSDHWYWGCMRVRNARLVECASDLCISYHDKTIKSGTGQTVAFAKKKGLKIVNLFGKGE